MMTYDLFENFVKYKLKIFFFGKHNTCNNVSEMGTLTGILSVFRIL